MQESKPSGRRRRPTQHPSPADHPADQDGVSDGVKYKVMHAAPMNTHGSEVPPSNDATPSLYRKCMALAGGGQREKALEVLKEAVATPEVLTQAMRERLLRVSLIALAVKLGLEQITGAICPGPEQSVWTAHAHA